MTTPIARWLVSAVLLAACATAPAPAEPPPTNAAPAQPQPQPEAAQPPRDPFAGLPPQVRVGARAAQTQRTLWLIPVVVIVPDGASYLAAISRWSIYARYPVLIDDGSWESRQNIARFIRAFRPRDVVRWSAPEGETELAADPHARRRQIEHAVARSWDAPDATGLRERWDAISLTPPGLVAANEGDSAWTAALALAAGRGQIVVWVPPSRDPVNWHADLRAVDDLSRLIENAAAASGYSWDGLGDDLDAITLCLNFPIKIDLGESNRARMWATTDVLGRARDGDRTRRWAWAGQVFGSESAAAYRAMCALFLRARNAWLFDGYENNPPWSEWDATTAAAELARVGIPSVVNDDGAQSADDFRLRAAGRQRGAAADPLGGVRFGLIAVNTSGNPEYFDLRPGRALAGDVPLMAQPAMVHFVHSWSANRPEDRTTVAGRFLEHGAYAYIGSVHEPFLQAFAPTPMFARRLIVGAPFGVAGRLDGGPPWKIAVIGDPLATLAGEGIVQPTESLPLEGARRVHDSMAAALRERDFDTALKELSLLARDDDAVRLVRAISADQSIRLGPDAALAAIGSLYYAGAFDLVVDVFPLARHGLGVTPALRDILWHTLWPTLSTLRPHESALLRMNLREGTEQMARDAAEVYRALERTDGRDAAQQFLAQARRELPSDDARRRLDELLR